MKDWKQVRIDFDERKLDVRIPPRASVLTMSDALPASDPAAEIEQALARPIHSPPLEDIVRRCGTDSASLQVAVAVSDITRPVPYKGESGLLAPLIRRLETAGVRRENVTLVVATGMHRPSTPEEDLEMFGPEIVHRFEIVNHACDDEAGLVSVGTTASGTDVSVNRRFASADLRIVTGLVESHFMAGFSGGRKSVCPGLVDEKTIQRLHGPEVLEHPRTDNLVLDGNPCHDEAVEVARKVGVDFSVNVTLDRRFRIVRVFAGDLLEAHRAACEDVVGAIRIPVEREADIVLTHGGYVGRNHYQTAKAACSALPAVKPSGTLIIAADNRDEEPVGGPAYRTLLHLLSILGPDAYVEMLKSPFWPFTRDQWEPEMWGRALRKLGPEGIVYCCTQIPEKDFACIPGRNGWAHLPEESLKGWEETMEAMVEGSLRAAVSGFQERWNREPEVAFLAEGPYGVPVLRSSESDDEEDR